MSGAKDGNVGNGAGVVGMGVGKGLGWRGWRLVPLTLGFAELFAVTLLFGGAERGRRGR